MADEDPRRVKCSQCGYETSTESGEWETARHQHLASISQCPICGTLTVHRRT